MAGKKVFNTASENEAQVAIDYLNDLVVGKKVVSIEYITETRSLSTNSYMHLIFRWFGLEYGETEDYVKQFIFKRMVNRDIFREEVYIKRKKRKRVRYKSTKDLTQEELNTAITRFRNWSAKEAGIYLAAPGEYAELTHYKVETEKNKDFL